MVSKKYKLSEPVTLKSSKPSNTNNVQNSGNAVSFVENSPPLDETDDFNYIGLSLEEVILKSEEKKWRIMRNAVYFATFVLILALIITAIVSALKHPRCRVQPSINWWDNAVYYRIYVPKFQDSNSDCDGDIKGIEMQLDYLKDIGVDAISLSPIYNGTSSVSDVNVINHNTVDTTYGTEDDIKSLIAAAHKKDMYVVLDFIPNQTSKKHVWFMASSKANPGDKKNYYLWTAGSSLPNNWLSVNGSESWTYSTDRAAHFLHQLSPDLPDLNLFSRVVVDELNKILQYWISLGVDGFNIRHSGFLFEDYDLRNDIQLSSSKPNPYDNMEHINSFGLESNMLLFSEWHHLVKENQGKNGRSLMVGMDSWDEIKTSYRDHFGVIDLPNLSYCTVLKIDANCEGSCMQNFVEENLKNVSIGKSPTWMLGSDVMSRFSTRLGNDTKRKEMLTMIGLLLPGSAVLYYGDELNMVDEGQPDKSSISMSQPWRRRMKWDNSSGDYGFSNVSCGSVSSNSGMHAEEAKAEAGSMLNFIKKLNKLRKEDAFRFGSGADIRYGPNNGGVFSFVRGFDGVDCYLIAANLGSADTCEDLSSVSGGNDAEATVSLVTPSVANGYSIDDPVDTTCVKLKPYQGVVLTWKCGLYFK